MTSDKDNDASTKYSELGRLLEQLRLQKGWSLRKAAQMIGGISHSRLHDFERGHDPHSAIPTRPNEEILRRVAKAYSTEPSVLLRLAGYSSMGPLTEVEETLVTQFRILTPKGQAKLLECLAGLIDSSP